VTLDALIRMANQIAANQTHLPPDQAASQVAEHLRLFWTPGMRQELVAHAATGADDLVPVVLAALEQVTAAVPSS